MMKKSERTGVAHEEFYRVMKSSQGYTDNINRRKYIAGRKRKQMSI